MWGKVLRYEMNNLNYLGHNIAEYFIKFIIVLFFMYLKGKLLSSVAMICEYVCVSVCAHMFL